MLEFKGEMHGIDTIIFWDWDLCHEWILENETVKELGLDQRYGDLYISGEFTRSCYLYCIRTGPDNRLTSSVESSYKKVNKSAVLKGLRG